MIVITGASGFIGSCLTWELNKENINDIICVERFKVPEQWKNIIDRKIVDVLDINSIEKLKDIQAPIEAIIHLGAVTSTTERDTNYMMELNYTFSKRIFQLCKSLNCRLIYMSSASVYGSGEGGFSETSRSIPQNVYAFSKSLFDQWCWRQADELKQCVGLRLFNVYGPNEWHKGSMSSLVTKFYKNIKLGHPLTIFGDGSQQRDFIYVFDVVNVIRFFLKNPERSGIFNVGTSQSTSFVKIADILKNICGKEVEILYESIPIEIKKHYQYYTCADVSKLRKAGYNEPFRTIESGIAEYTSTYDPDEIVGSISCQKDGHRKFYTG